MAKTIMKRKIEVIYVVAVALIFAIVALWFFLSGTASAWFPNIF